MRLKSYIDFNSVNESFQRSNESENFLKDHSLDRDFFLDNLSYVNDIKEVGIGLVKYVCDKDGDFLTDKFDDSKEYRIRYMLNIKYSISTDDSKLEEFFKKIDEFDEIKTSIQEMIDRVSDKVTLVWDKVHFEPTETSQAISIKKFTYNFSLHFDSETINDKLKPYFDKYKTYIGPNYEKMMKELRAFYHAYDIDFDKNFDTIDDEGDVIRVGVFPPDEDLYHVADYYKSKDKYQLHHDEMQSSLRGGWPY